MKERLETATLPAGQTNARRLRETPLKPSHPNGTKLRWLKTDREMRKGICVDITVSVASYRKCEHDRVRVRSDLAISVIQAKPRQAELEYLQIGTSVLIWVRLSSM